MKDKLLSIVDNMKGKKIIVIGDIMLDKYIFSEVTRISPEAPVQVAKVEREKYIPGGASNVASNVASLGGDALMAGVVGKDEPGKMLIEELGKRKINTEGVFEDEGKPTTQKIRVLAQNQQLIRIDYEEEGDVKEEIEKKIIGFLLEKVKDADAIVFSDYAKGIITKRIIEKAKESGKGKIIVVDPKPNHVSFYNGVTIVTPNTKEAREMAGLESKDVNALGGLLIKKLGTNVLITQGEKGMALFEKNGNTVSIPTKAKEVYDVSGAGDTVVAALALALAAGASFEEGAVISNHAAGIVVGKIGTSTVSVEEIKRAIEDEYGNKN